jgi:hypothetical protein
MAKYNFIIKSLITSLLMFVFTENFAQDNLNFLADSKNSNSPYNQKKIEKLIKKELRKKGKFSSLEIRNHLKDVEYLAIPMYNLLLDDSVDISSDFNIFSHLKIENKFVHHYGIMFKKGLYFGYYDCEDIGGAGLVVRLAKLPLGESYYPDIDRLDIKQYDKVFVIRGIRAAWWLVKSNEIMVYSFLDDKIHYPQEFINEFYTNESIRKYLKHLTR